MTSNWEDNEYTSLIKTWLRARILIIDRLYLILFDRVLYIIKIEKQKRVNYLIYFNLSYIYNLLNTSFIITLFLILREYTLDLLIILNS